VTAAYKWKCPSCGSPNTKRTTCGRCGHAPAAIVEPGPEMVFEETVQSRIVRFIDRDGTGACKRSITARYDYTNKGWSMSLYEKNLTWGPLQAHDKMTDFSADNIDLVMAACRYFESIKGKLFDAAQEVVKRNDSHYAGE